MEKSKQSLTNARKQDITITHPAISKNWDYGKNDKKPQDYLAGSRYKAWWHCDKCGHSYQQVIRDKIRHNSGCPICRGRVVVKGYNDIMTTHPDRAKNWNWEKNDDTPYEYTAGSNKKKWWKCDNGHEYQRTICDELRKKTDKCTMCTGYSLPIEEKNITVLYPELMKQWDYSKNTIDPKDLFPSSNEIVWWKCDNGHSYQDIVSKATSRKNHKWCPICYGTILIEGINDLKTLYPEDIKQWDYKRNSDNPSKTTKRSRKKYWWICENGHSYQKCIQEKTLKTSKCPICINSIVIPGVNDLLTTHPKIAEQWDYEKNTIFPTEVSAGSHKYAWFKCDNGHNIKQQIEGKTRNGYGCKYCSNNEVLTGYNDLKTKFPEMIKYWDYAKNDVSPENVHFGSSKKYWWICDKGHNYQQPLKYKIKGHVGCDCSKAGISKKEKELYETISKSLGKNIDIETNNRTVLSDYKELDIYIPEKKVAIEFKGLYWHTEKQGKDRWYHYNKWKECKDKGIQLITIWEDDWDNKKDIIKTMLEHKLSTSKKDKIYARKTFVKEVDYLTAKNFCEKYHIQGFTFSSNYFALFDNENTIVAMSIWRTLKDKVYLDRYCTSINVVGGCGKLVKYASKYYKEKEINQIITFADHTVSDGKLYDILGFKKETEIKPDYSYLHNFKREHKFNFRKRKFKSNPDLIFEENLTEKELADLNEIYRIWDCGKDKYVLNI